MKSSLPLLPVRFCPSKETLALLNEFDWVASYSKGKDSTTLVTWIEWLRRVGLVRADRPRATMSDTTIDYPFLSGVADDLMAALTASGWEFVVVVPDVSQRLYTRIFGVGVPPVHPGGRKMRWCTRATKTDPMRRRAKLLGGYGDVVQLSGIRWGESDVRDAKLRAAGCAAGGECGLPEPGGDVKAPIVTWTTCKVVEWLNGEAGEAVTAAIPDLVPITRRLVEVYGAERGRPDLYGVPAKVRTGRFGCMGCPAVNTDKVLNTKAAGDPRWQHLRRVYGVWGQCYEARNRLVRVRDGKVRRGPLRMEARQRLYAELLAIQADSGVTLVKPDEDAFVRDCWARRVYPRGWSEADELVEPPDEGLFKGCQS